ncbi:MAG: metallophosphoesterase [candidate division KSB1 bacterium]|nr:metallophosphoesterase [candidate division KSB1 bacterium]
MKSTLENQSDFDLLIVSDLHLSEGRNKQDGKFSPNEDFLYDEEFDRFLRYHEKQAEALGKKWKLIINGDLIDYWQVITSCRDREIPAYIDPAKLTPTEMEFGPGSAPEKCVWKTNLLMDGHATFFQALGRFMSQGHQVIILKGNHDVELHWEEVQAQFRKRIPHSENLKFLPWFYYEEGLVYIEHGGQYEKENSIRYYLNPLLPPPLCPASEKLLELPFSSFFVRYFFNRVEALHPFADNIKPTSQYIIWTLKNHFFESWKILKKYIPAIFRILKKSQKWPQPEEKKLQVQHDQELKDLEKKLNLEGKLEKIDSLKELPVTTSKFKFLKEMLKGPATIMSLALFIGLLVLYGLIYITTYLSQAPISLSLKSLYLTLFVLVILIGGGLLVVCSQSSLGKQLQEGTREILRQKARAVSQILNVKYIIFGHSHDADILRLSDNCLYLNSGTWVPVYSGYYQMLWEDKQFTFVQISNGRARLLRWDDKRGAVGEVKLIDNHHQEGSSVT